MITSTTRNSLYLLFNVLLIGFNEFLLHWFSWFELFLIIIGAGIIIKLTDIEEAIIYLK